MKRNPLANSNLCHAAITFITYASKINTASHITGIILADNTCSAMPVTPLAVKSLGNTNMHHC